MRSFLSLFSFYGRSNRVAYWIYFLVSIVGALGIGAIFDLVIFRFNLGGVVDSVRTSSPAAVQIFHKLRDIPAAAVIAIGVIGAVLFLGLALAWVSIAVRRLHDMGASGWLVLIFVVISVVGNIFGYILTTLVLGSWPSSRKNRYGSALNGREVLGVFDDRRPAETV